MARRDVVRSPEPARLNPREIYAKTDEGARELKERSRTLSIGLRSLLIMIDGKHTVADLLQRAGSLRVDEASFSALEAQGLITRRFAAPSAAASTASDSGPRSETDVQRFLAVQQRMSDAISTHLGFRGYLLMMRLQRAQNLRDLHDLLADVVQAVDKRAGARTAGALAGEVERLIAGVG